MRQRTSKLKVFSVMRILALSMLLISAGLNRPAQTFAQEDCQQLNDLMTFDYRDWGIGVHRDCKCEEGDIGCYVGLPLCLLMKAKQIAAGEPVEAWIRLSYAAALAAGVSPMPQEIRKKLVDLYPARLLDKVRYKTGSGFLGSLQWFRSEIEGKGAITLDDVIVFAKAEKAQDARLWAHELEHVRQYDQLGISGFAQAYVDQTCILPGELGYDSGNCQLERRAKNKETFWDQNNRVICCTRPAEVVIRDRVLNETEEFVARRSITIGPNVVLQAGANVTLRAGRVITMSPDFRTEPGGKLFAGIDPSVNPGCLP